MDFSFNVNRMGACQLYLFLFMLSFPPQCHTQDDLIDMGKWQFLKIV